MLNINDENALHEPVQEPVTMGELCEAIMNGRVVAVVRDGHYEVKAVDVRGMRRSAESLMATLERLRPRLPLNASGFEQIGPCCEDVS